MTLALGSPSLGFIDSYRAYLREFDEAGEERSPFTTDYPNGDAEAFLARLSTESAGEGLPDGYVAHTTYWMIRDDRDVVGVANLRHSLTPHLRHEGGHIGYGIRPSARGKGFATELLRMTLERAEALGLERVLVISAQENEPSIRTILRNGGVLEAEGIVAQDGTRMNRYWIELGRSVRPISG